LEVAAIYEAMKPFVTIGLHVKEKRPAHGRAFLVCGHRSG
jgi:hypothetical protein